MLRILGTALLVLFNLQFLKILLSYMYIRGTRISLFLSERYPNTVNEALFRENQASQCIVVTYNVGERGQNE